MSKVERLTMIITLSTISLPGLVASAQLYEVKDRNGNSMLTVEATQMFRYSDYFKREIPDFKGVVRSVFDGKLLGVVIVGHVHKKDGTVHSFTLNDVCDSGTSCGLDSDFHKEIEHSFMQPSPFTRQEVDYLDFTLDTAERIVTHDGFHASGFVANDEDCLSDYVASKALKGVQLRKKITELLQYGCGFILDKPQAVDVLDKPKKIIVTGKTVKALNILVLDERILLGLEHADHYLESGWILSDSLIPGPVLALEQIGVAQK